MMDFLITLASAAGEHAESGGIISDLAGQFHIDVKTILFQMVNFTIVAVLLYKLAFKPVLATIEERQNKIADGLQYAEEMKVKLADAEKQTAATLRQAQLDAQKIIQETRVNAKNYFDKQVQESAAKAEETMTKAKEAIELERQKMLTEVRQEVARLVVVTSGKVLSRELSVSEKQTYNKAATEELSAL